jgi:hypothetical protein
VAHWGLRVRGTDAILQTRFEWSGSGSAAAVCATVNRPPRQMILPLKLFSAYPVKGEIVERSNGITLFVEEMTKPVIAAESEGEGFIGSLKEEPGVAGQA